MGEARVLATFDHPNIVRIYDYVDEPDDAWIVEEWVNGSGLDAVAAQGRLTGQQALGVLHGALTGLAHAHENGVVHGDIKPTNILVDLQGTSKLIDFGLATRVDGSIAADGSWSGTPGYTAPEVIESQPVAPVADVYAAGVVLHELLSGAKLFNGDSPAEVITAQLSGSVPPIADIGDGLNQLVGDATSTDPARRPHDAADFLERLDTAAAERYGAGWWSAASVAALAAAGATALAAGAHAAATTGGAAAANATQTVSAKVVATMAGGRVGRSAARKWIYAGVGVGAAAGVVAAVVVLRPRSRPTVEGRWNVAYTMTDAASIGPRVGETVSNTVELKGSCPSSRDGNMTMAVPGATQPGRVQRNGATYSAQISQAEDCVSPSGRVIQKNAGTQFQHFDFHVTKSADGKATEWKGTWESDFSAEPQEAGVCGASRCPQHR